jgi:hypothetical protein
MPVHRAQGAESKSPVFAYKDELDRWFQGTFKNSNPSAEKAPAGRPWLKWTAAGAVLVALAGLYLYFGGDRIRRQPADFAIDGSFFVALDKQKRELWRKDTGMENLWPESTYRLNFQVMNTLEANILPVLVMKDIDGDGDTEVLFAPRRTTDQTGEGILICYDRLGKERWMFPAGKELVCRDKIFSPDYRIAGFHCHDLDGDGRSEIVVESFQSPDWPCQLAVLDLSGNTVGEFWNAGYLRDLKYHDITGDGREEIIVCGVNNEYRGGCLIVFDTRDIHGGSPASGEYVCQGIGPGSMLYYVITPYVDVSEASGDRVDGLRLIEVTQNNWIRTTAPKGLIYEFDFSLACIQVSPGNVFKVLHKEFADAGKITSVLGPEYMRELREGVRYWNGSAMVPEPSMVRR